MYLKRAQDDAQDLQSRTSMFFYITQAHISSYSTYLKSLLLHITITLHPYLRAYINVNNDIYIYRIGNITHCIHLQHLDPSTVLSMRYPQRPPKGEVVAVDGQITRGEGPEECAHVKLLDGQIKAVRVSHLERLVPWFVE